MCYAPVCQGNKLPLDLHALDMPPAFILSQDQTLSLNMRVAYSIPVMLLLDTASLLFLTNKLV
jgi:hypothetical protein